ncbi:hypothetical protein WPS_32730 [Vulcanimicrobium alpinum]|uniref:Outer membrane lipoprotein-sorting protein n=2 Tax=Vulcanimicrobium alpinum TaxID=3016050 RepID=A0AAN1XZ02_UNVUL|nr:hypothetical protein WPS_32730 [Vulcanimicrobium alpinum]
MPRRTLASIAIATAFACTAQTAAPVPRGDEILRLAKAAFRAHAHAPFVSYTVERTDRRRREYDMENSYTLRVWCRRSDRSALTRRQWNGSTVGPLENVTVAFDGRVDPGPPDADVFEPRLYARPAPSPEPSATDLPTIGVTSVTVEGDYRVERVARDGDAWHLWLIWKRDPERNRIDELWVDAETYELRRMKVRDHLYLGDTGASLPEEFDVRFAMRDGTPLIATIDGRTDDWEFETHYAFRDVTFAQSLPDWYFQPQRYGAHKGDAPV